MTEQLLRVISDISTCTTPCLLMGDFNFPDIQWHDTPTAKSKNSNSFITFCNDHNFYQMVDNPTHLSNILDLVLCNQENLVKSLKIEPPIGNSDHATVFFELELLQETPPFVLRRNYKSANYDKIQSYLYSVDWYGSFNTVDTVNEKYEMFLSILKHSIELFVPVERVLLNQPNLPSYLNSLYRIRSRAWEHANKDNTPELWEKFHLFDRKFHRKLYKYNCSIEKKIIESKNKPLFYKLLRSRLTRKEPIAALKGNDGNLIRTNTEKVELLADSFEKVYDNTNCRKIPSLSFEPKPPMQDSLWFHRDKLYTLLSKWPSSYSRTPDDIPFFFIRSVRGAIVGPLEFIFNLSFMRGEIPAKWKHALVTPIPKKPPFDLADNYRPISITSIFSRLFEKILKERIVNHLEAHKIISPSQHGFQKGRSTETAMLSALNHWTSTLDDKKPLDVVYFDFAKAFDKVSHELLLLKLAKIGIHEQIISWLKCFLTERTFQVCINDTLSSIRRISSGVPQGGVLSPILFNIYIYTCELPDIIAEEGVGCIAYADDLKIYNPIVIPSDNMCLQKAIDAVATWASEWKLPLSKQKTKVLHIGRNNPKLKYNLCSESVSETSEIVDLGYIIDENLSFDKYCKEITAKATRQIYCLFKALRTKNVAIMIKAYKTYVRPIMEYGTTIFNPHKKSLINMIEKVQNNFTRKLMIRTPLYKRRRRNDLLMMYKILHSLCGLKSSDFYVMRSLITRGGTIKPHITTAKTAIRQNFFTHRAVSDYLKFSKNKRVPVKLSLYKRAIGEYLDN
ncbi:hypothetical protein Y032_0378g284 [Ancylostoma ceylanicum]|uniref:Reverse transcriptase domain-containing protein n=3 Tax=Ancylostoma ceylanicum TaxID=53326 RepID=A0A016RU42_9BILA|nr:hypothetical protein Y032_0378g284 [Ancylostoma ceylanicum]